MKRLLLILFALSGIAQAQVLDTCVIIGEMGALYQQRLRVSSDPSDTITWRVGVIYIRYPEPSGSPLKIRAADWDSMWNSTSGYWYDTIPPTPHPQNKKIRGSFRETFRSFSRGKWDFVMTRVNPTMDSAGVIIPKFIYMSFGVSYYNTRMDELSREVAQRIIDSGYVSSLSDYDSYVVIEAGNRQFGWAGATLTSNGTFYAVGQIQAVAGLAPDFGRAAHEMGHLIWDWPDEYRHRGNDTPNGGFDLMASGSYNGDAGTDQSANFPSPPNVVFRGNIGWMNRILLPYGAINLTLRYGNVYTLRTNKGETIELAKMLPFERDRLPNMNSRGKNVMVWTYDFPLYGNYDGHPVWDGQSWRGPDLRIITANNQAIQSEWGAVFNDGLDTNVYFPRIPLTKQDLTFFTTPRLSNRDNSFAGIEIKGIRHGDSVAYIDTIKIYPTVSIASITNISPSGASVNVFAYPGAASTTVRLVWAACRDDDMFACNFQDSPPTDSITLGVVSGVDLIILSQQISGLAASRWYVIQARGYNLMGSSHSSQRAFRTALAPPTVVTLTPINVTKNSATLRGIVNPNGATTTARFRYGRTTITDSVDITLPQPAGVENFTVSYNVTGLTPNTGYIYQIVAYNSRGSAVGDIVGFSTLPDIPSPPTATTGSASSITTTSATLKGIVNARGSSTTVRFRWKLSTSNTYTDSALAIESPVSGSANTAVSYGIAGLLLPGRKYNFQVVAHNIGGTAVGAESTFTTLAGKPFITFADIIDLRATSVTFAISFNDSGSVLTALRAVYGRVSGVYTDSVNIPQPHSGELTANGSASGLTPLTTYYWRARAYNAIGGVQSVEKRFTTLPPGGVVGGRTIFTGK